MPYLGKTPSQATRKRYYLTASGGETSISGTMTTGGTLTFNDGEFVDVSVNGVALVAGTDYNTTTANTIGGLSALTASDQVEIVVYDTFSVFGGNVDGDFTINNGTLTAGTTNLDGAVTITTDDNSANLTLTSTDADANSAPVLHLDRNSASPADDDRIAEIVLRGRNDAGQTVDYIMFDSFIRDASDGSEDSEIDFRTMVAGSEATRMIMKPAETVFNEASIDLDFRVESNGNANMLVVDGGNDRVGIGTSSPATLLHLNSAADTQFTIGTTNATADGRIQFRNSGGTDAGGLWYATNNNTMLFRTNSAERMRLTNDGGLFINKTSANTGTVGFEFRSDNNKLAVGASADPSLFVNRNSSDGIVVQIAHEGGVEGSISTSGTTVSFNGGHLSRWSRLADDSKDTSILKGTVMTNLDKMVVWHHEAQAATYYEEGDELPEGVSIGDEKTPAVAAYDEDNEQLNCMAVSSVEGDTNVAGVFVNWDEDDDFNDMNVAMTGDMVIRIAQGTTVARGDLLMSAGDGTAKPQGDDIVRSKTIAKVTSTNVSHTYDDGSYLVPCVLMAC